MLHTVGLLLLGLVMANSQLFGPIHLSPDLAFYLLLPPILFQGGMHLNLQNLKEDWKLIALLAVPGVVAATLMVGYPLAHLWNIPLNMTLLFGALISPTDPVLVLAIIRKMKAPQRLRTILEAESLFNDGTGIVLFMVILSMAQNNKPFHLGEALFQFLLVTGGGALVGGVCGYSANRLIKLTHRPLVILAVTVMLVFGTPILAQALHCSGIIAIVVAGILVGKTPKSVEAFWHTIDFILNSLIFLIIGLQLQVVGKNNLITFKEQILVGIIIVLLSRALIVYLTMRLYNRTLKSSIPPSWDHILFWGGLRGTIPIILMMQLPESQYRPLFLCATFGIVLFSTFVQGLTMERTLRKLSINRGE